MPNPVKIYDRPERSGPPPLMIAVIVIVLLIASYFLFKAFYHPASSQQHTRADVIQVQYAFWQERQSDGRHDRSASYQ